RPFGRVLVGRKVAPPFSGLTFPCVALRTRSAPAASGHLLACPSRVISRFAGFLANLDAKTLPIREPLPPHQSSNAYSPLERRPATSPESASTKRNADRPEYRMVRRVDGSSPSVRVARVGRGRAPIGWRRGRAFVSSQRRPRLGVW